MHNAVKVLIAEDEFLIRCVTADSLSRAGFDLIETENAEQALALLEQPDLAVDVLFTDILMRGSFDGLALARRARALRPQIAIIIASGHPGPLEVEMPTDARFVSKPYSLDAMAKLIGTMVQGRVSIEHR